MTISYPLTMPTTPAFQTQNWSLQRAVGVSESPFTGVQQTVEFDYAKWKAVVQLPPQRRDTAQSWIAFLTKLHGRRGTFFLGDADQKTPRGSVSGTITIGTSASIGDTIITLSSNAGFKAGDMIQVGTGSASRLYMIVADQENANVQIEPKIKTAASAGTTVTYTNPVGIFRLDSNIVNWDTNQISIYGISFACSEAD